MPIANTVQVARRDSRQLDIFACHVKLYLTPCRVKTSWEIHNNFWRRRYNSRQFRFLLSKRSIIAQFCSNTNSSKVNKKHTQYNAVFTLVLYAHFMALNIFGLQKMAKITVCCKTRRQKMLQAFKREKRRQRIMQSFAILYKLCYCAVCFQTNNRWLTVVSGTWRYDDPR